MRILLTGANGFIGHATANALASSEHHVLQQVRQYPAPNQMVLRIDQNTDWSAALSGCDVVLHLAARAHVMLDDATDPLSIFREVNTAGTLNLALQAASNGIRRFVFISSIKVCGQQTEPFHSFRHGDTPAPQDLYGISKYEAEVGLRRIAADTGMEVVIVRPPLVYGPGVKGNFAAMMRAVKRGLPLPFGLVTNNRRSMVALDNLVDLLITCLDHPAAANQIFLVSDGDDLSTSDLLQRLGIAIGKSARLFPVPLALLNAGAYLLRKVDVAQRLLGNLQIDMSYTCETLGWKPPIGVNEGLRRAARIGEK